MLRRGVQLYSQGQAGLQRRPVGLQAQQRPQTWSPRQRPVPHTTRGLLRHVQHLTRFAPPGRACLARGADRTKEVAWKPMADPLQLASHVSLGPDSGDMQVQRAACMCICMSSLRCMQANSSSGRRAHSTCAECARDRAAAEPAASAQAATPCACALPLTACTPDIACRYMPRTSTCARSALRHCCQGWPLGPGRSQARKQRRALPAAWRWRSRA